MTTATQTLVDFLRARLDEDAAAATGTGPSPWKHDPAWHGRVLREVAAKRAILAEIESRDDFNPEMWGMGRLPARTLLALASAYADHPDFDSDWA